MMSFNLCGLFFLFAVILIIAPTSLAQCIRNRDGCQPDGSQGVCCSGFCYKEANWVAGYCK
ncbi:antimicrobial peptide Alo-2-like [Leptopilina boulardi]|uniref:antimicrobial peptide Alo-2-like n=1 Tax=Leptopilina boulardi TaxID=63433 RepID=UPI0021F61DFB|nr:antimicrobial peptide Alo-2-like [Leptopilina boulardi]XP_051170844.1 antimicrobial peptide Alo-2-like [Leptopilina boulardi]XP_051170845.1 antimicrobial peptide Alo-2-like [Leptopilina boulardi]XP_051170846.1 antimicrobial peptide Alo-2-like [Leptopilina boulardi]XP_051170847.1 antimicrobial peptide Alo-2-like [Leptopilina boulardi]